jgi:hypothetical protein
MLSLSGLRRISYFALTAVTFFTACAALSAAQETTSNPTSASAVTCQVLVANDSTLGVATQNKSLFNDGGYYQLSGQVDLGCMSPASGWGFALQYDASTSALKDSTGRPARFWQQPYVTLLLAMATYQPPGNPLNARVAVFGGLSDNSLNQGTWDIQNWLHDCLRLYKFQAPPNLGTTYVAGFAATIQPQLTQRGWMHVEGLAAVSGAGSFGHSNWGLGSAYLGAMVGLTPDTQLPCGILPSNGIYAPCHDTASRSWAGWFQAGFDVTDDQVRVLGRKGHPAANLGLGLSVAVYRSVVLTLTHDVQVVSHDAQNNTRIGVSFKF